MSLASPAAKPNQMIDYGLLLLLASLWGASYTFIKIGIETIPPITFIAGRTLIAGLLLLLVMRLRGINMPMTPAIWKLFAFQALMNSVVPFTLIAWAEIHIEAGLGTILNATVPVFTFLITLCIKGAEATTIARSWMKLAGVILGLAGIVLIVGTEAFKGLGVALLAQMAVLFASACYSVASIFGRNFKGMDAMIPAAGSLLSGALALIPLSIMFDQPWNIVPSQSSLLALVALSVFSTAFAFVLYFRLLKTLGPVGTTSQAYLRVPIGVGLGILFLDETLASTAFAGLVLVCLGVAAMTRPDRPVSK